VKRDGLIDRRGFFGLAGAGALVLGGCKRDAPTSVIAIDAGPARFPEKAADLILHTDRPPNLETPLRYFRQDLTPNDAMFVRWHVSSLPLAIDLRAWRLRIEGHVDHSLALSLDELRAMEPVSIVAVNQCSGNSRALFAPRVPGVQWARGAIGNAKWTGVRLKDLLAKAGVRAAARDVTFRGLDKAPRESVPEFVKSLAVDRANDPDVIVAYAMNDAPLPMLNGFPARLVVPGWFSTYWVKSLSEIRVLDDAFDGFWMAKAYRIPKTAGADESPTDLAKETTPISKMNVRSLIVRPEADELVPAGRAYEIEGLAFDGGAGIKKVEVSTDGGATWSDARLDADLGRYSWRRWRATWTPPVAPAHAILARATSAAGEEQRATPQWNRAGYMRNVFERVDVRGA
jgi:DMSO/TMAO reductase YedYZ molybdopterin-dependent catalytic subunit